MASGSKSVAATSYDTLKFSWWENSQSIDGNYTIVGWKLELIAASYGYISSSASKSWSVTVNGSSYSGSNTIGISNNSTKTLASGTTTISHGSDGTKSFDYSFSQQFSINFNGWVGTISGSGSGTLTTIPRKSSLTVSNGTLGTAQTVTVNRKSTSFTHTVTYECGSYSGTLCTKSTVTSLSFTPALNFANGAPYGESVYVSFKIDTYNGSTLIGSDSASIYCAIPASVKPTVSFTVSDPTGYLSTYSGYVQSKSKFNISVTGTGVYSSSITSYSTTVDGKTYSGSSFTTDEIKSSGSLTITVTVTDSRGRTASTTKTVTVLAYEAPKISSLVVKRCTSNGTSSSSGAYLSVIFTASATSLNSKNTVAYKVQYKKKSATTYTSATITTYANKYSVENGSYVFAADTSSSYDIILSVTDKFSTASKTGEGQTTSKLFSMLHRGLGWAFGKVAEVEDALDVAWNLYVRKNAYITDTMQAKDIKATNEIYDKFGNRVRNGLATYTGSGNNATDPNTTTEQLIITDKNVPINGFAYVENMFYNTKSSSTNRGQIAVPYSKTGSMYHRYYYNGAWSGWKQASFTTQKVLWSGGVFLQGGQTVTFSESISSQPNGIVLLFVDYDSRASDNCATQGYWTCYIPKQAVTDMNGRFWTCSTQYWSTTSVCNVLKGFYVSDTKITGHDYSVRDGSVYGIGSVLCRVYGV